jgi:Tol biopolymer transport system component
MADQRLRELGARIEDSIQMHDFDQLVRRGRRRVAVRRAGTLAVVAVAIAAVFGVGHLVDRDAQTGQRFDRHSRGDIFAGIHGWIVYGEPPHWGGSDAFVLGNGIWAVNPTKPGGDASDQIRVSKRSGEPLGWSSDGSKLLIRRPVQRPTTDGPVLDYDLVVLNADGTETPVTRGRAPYGRIDGSISPDGSRVVYSSPEGIYAFDLQDGTRHLLLRRAPRRPPGEPITYPTSIYNPVFSPDGTQIAYFDGMGDWGHSLRVMRSDGTNVRILFDRKDEPTHIQDLVWSPDGQRLAFSGPDRADRSGIWIIGVDGSGFTKVVTYGSNPAWSPDGTRIAYSDGTLRIADTDGTHVTKFGYGGSGPWNPLPLDQ